MQNSIEWTKNCVFGYNYNFSVESKILLCHWVEAFVLYIILNSLCNRFENLYSIKLTKTPQLELDHKSPEHSQFSSLSLNSEITHVVLLTATSVNHKNIRTRPLSLLVCLFKSHYSTLFPLFYINHKLKLFADLESLRKTAQKFVPWNRRQLIGKTVEKLDDT